LKGHGFSRAVRSIRCEERRLSAASSTTIFKYCHSDRSRTLSEAEGDCERRNPLFFGHGECCTLSAGAALGRSPALAGDERSERCDKHLKIEKGTTSVVPHEIYLTWKSGALAPRPVTNNFCHSDESRTLSEAEGDGEWRNLLFFDGMNKKRKSRSDCVAGKLRQPGSID
jgi:hypothetical protein